MYYVMYNNSDVVWEYEEHAFFKLANYPEWKLYGIATTEDEAENMMEEACYIA